MFFFSFFLFFSKWYFASFTKIVIIIFCLLKVLFEGLTTLKSMAEINKKKNLNGQIVSHKSVRIVHCFANDGNLIVSPMIKTEIIGFGQKINRAVKLASEAWTV